MIYNNLFKSESIIKTMSKQVVLEERAQQFVTKSCTGKIQVDWKSLAAQQRDSQISGDKRLFPHVLDNILEYLKEIGALVHAETPGSYFATGCRVPLNPSPSNNPMTKFSFADEQDARNYYSEFFKRVQYEIIIHQTIGIVKKAE
jgi:hypothetical protein